MKAILLAAGFGSRLHPLTQVIPKCLMPLNGRPLLDYWMDSLSKCGIDDCLINTHYKSEMVKEWGEGSIYADKILFSQENSILGTAGTLLANRSWIGESPVMLIHADNVCDADINEFIMAHQNRPQNTDITMMTFTTDSPETCGIVDMDSDGVVQGFYEKVNNPPSKLANAAVYIIERSVINELIEMDSEPTDFSTEVIPLFMGRIFTYHNNRFHRDIGNVSSYISTQIDYDGSNQPTKFCPSWSNLVKKRQISENLSSSIEDAIQKKVELLGSPKESPNTNADIIVFSEVPHGFSSKEFYGSSGIVSVAISDQF